MGLALLVQNVDVAQHLNVAAVYLYDASFARNLYLYAANAHSVSGQGGAVSGVNSPVGNVVNGVKREIENARPSSGGMSLVCAYGITTAVLYVCESTD